MIKTYIPDPTTVESYTRRLFFHICLHSFSRSTAQVKPSDVFIDHSNHSALIQGKDGAYNVSLTQCTCFDFESRQLPCKHIYKLAFELGLLDNLPKLNHKAAKSFKDSIPDEIERFKEYYLNDAISIDKFAKIVAALQSK